MCGIIGYLGHKNAKEIIIKGLKRLEYRGYDSVGIAIFEEDSINSVKCSGKVGDLENQINDSYFQGTVGIGHTRWATHGKPEVRNAHPHIDFSGEIAVVQNGIIENHRELSKSLKSKG